MSVILERAQALQTTSDQVRDARIDAEDGFLRIDRVRDALRALALQPSLFRPGHFPVAPGSPGAYYRLSEEPDYRFAFYVSASQPRRANLPHTHPTWTVVAGIRGSERNRIYTRVDDGATPGRGVLRLRREVDVGPGDALSLFAGEFHYIEVTSAEVSLQLHVYGVGFPGWRGELPIFPAPDSGVYETVPAPLPGLRLAIPRVSATELVDAWCAREPVVVVAVDGAQPISLPLPDPVAMVVDAWEPRRLPAERASLVVLTGADHAVHQAADHLLSDGYRSVLRYVPSGDAGKDR